MSRTDRVCILQVDVCIHVSTCMYCAVCMHTQGRMHVQCTYTFFTCRCSMVSHTDRVCVLQVDVCIHVYTCMYCAVCMDTHGCMYVQCTYTILYMQVLIGCLALTEFVSCRLMSVYMYLHACTVQFVCTHMDACMYNDSLHAGAQWVFCSDRVCVLQVDVCMHVSTCMYCPVCMHTHGRMHVQCTLYMQVLNGCLAVTEFVSCRLTSVYMYIHACTVQFVWTHMDVCMYNVHIQFFTCRCSLGVSH